MPDPISDPYETLGISRTASDAELRSAYRRLVLRHHPDHNGGSADSARRFAAIQEAHARITSERRAASPPVQPRGEQPAQRRAAAPVRETPYSDDAINAKLAEMEREAREAYAAKERARREAAATAVPQQGRTPTPEELGYVTTDDSLGQIFDDALDSLQRSFKKARSTPLRETLTDFFADSE